MLIICNSITPLFIKEIRVAALVAVQYSLPPAMAPKQGARRENVFLFCHIRTAHECTAESMYEYYNSNIIL